MNKDEALAQIKLLTDTMLGKERIEYTSEQERLKGDAIEQNKTLYHSLPECFQPFFMGSDELGQGIIDIPGYNIIKTFPSNYLIEYKTITGQWSEDIAWVLARAKKVNS